MIHIRIALCDDEKSALQEYNSLISNILNNENIPYTITEFTSGKGLLFSYSHPLNSPFDLIFLDIELPDINGLNVAEHIRQTDNNVLIVFMTAHPGYVFKSFEYSPFRYIPKNQTSTFLSKTLIEAAEITKKHEEKCKCYYISTMLNTVKLPYNSILYIDKRDKYSIFHTIDDRIHALRISLSEVYRELAPHDFIMISSGCIINLKYLLQFQYPKVILENSIGQQLEFLASRPKKKGIRESIHNYWSRDA